MQTAGHEPQAEEKSMSTYPFRDGGSARDREEALFAFLAEQAVHPDLAVWERIAGMSGRQEDLGYMALLLQNLTERRVPTTVSDHLYSISETLLGKLGVDSFSAWLRLGLVDAPRLAGFLDHTLGP
jgi:hypothetical protein